MGLIHSSNLLDSENTYSFHVQKNFGGNVWLDVWPYAGFGQYCSDEDVASKQFEEETKEQGKCRLVRNKAVVSDNKIIGCVSGTMEVLKMSE
jgi:hypothetical protein